MLLFLGLFLSREVQAMRDQSVPIASEATSMLSFHFLAQDARDHAIISSDAEFHAKLLATKEASERTRSQSLAMHRQSRAISHQEQHDQHSQNSRVMYGLVTNSLPKYRTQLEAVLHTWGTDVRAKGFFLAVAGHGYPAEWQDGSVIAVDCPDQADGNACKEASLIIEASRRNATWLIVVGEDNYMDTAMVEAAIAGVDPKNPVGLGCIGCGKGLHLYGDKVNTLGGFCGGCGEALSQATLNLLAEKGWDALVSEYGSERQCDMSTSRAMLDRGLSLQVFPGVLSGYPMFSRQEFEHSSNFASFHYVGADVMRWLHAKRQQKVADLPALDKTAFDEFGCVRNMVAHWWDAQINACRETAQEQKLPE